MLFCVGMFSIIWIDIISLHHASAGHDPLPIPTGYWFCPAHPATYRATFNLYF